MDSLQYLLMRAHTCMQRRILSAAGELGLSPGQPKILEYLLSQGESNQKAIAAGCEIEPATVGSILLRMERDGLVCRTQRQGNRRFLWVSLTPRGRQLALEMEKVFCRADRQAEAPLTEEQRRQLCQLLKVLCDGLAPKPNCTERESCDGCDEG